MVSNSDYLDNDRYTDSYDKLYNYVFLIPPLHQDRIKSFLLKNIEEHYFNLHVSLYLKDRDNFIKALIYYGFEGLSDLDYDGLLESFFNLFEQDEAKINELKVLANFPD